MASLRSLQNPLCHLERFRHCSDRKQLNMRKTSSSRENVVSAGSVSLLTEHCQHVCSSDLRHRG